MVPKTLTTDSEPHCEIHPQDAEPLNIDDNTLVRIESAQGTFVARAHLCEDQLQGNVFASMHWTDQSASKARVNALVPETMDPFSGQPASKNTAVKLSPLQMERHGFAVMSCRPLPDIADYWACARTYCGWRLEFAFNRVLADFAETARSMCGASFDALKVDLKDPDTADERVAFFDGDQLLGAFFLSGKPLDIQRNHIAEALTKKFHNHAERFHLVADSGAFGGPAPGRTICACLSVGAHDISSAILSGCMTLESIGAATGAGIECGTCHAEIQRLVTSITSRK